MVMVDRYHVSVIRIFIRQSLREIHGETPFKTQIISGAATDGSMCLYWQLLIIFVFRCKPGSCSDVNQLLVLR